MNDGRWHTAEIQAVGIEHKKHRVRSFLNRLLPNHVQPPEKRSRFDIRSGDSIVLPDGRKRRLGMVVQSAEGVRFYGSTLPLPGFEERIVPPFLEEPKAHQDYDQTIESN